MKRSPESILRQKITRKMNNVVRLQCTACGHDELERKAFDAQWDFEQWIFKEICAASTRGYLVGRQPGGVLKKGEKV